MKKKYAKPEIHFENFRLSQHIAACSITVQSTSPIECTGTGTVTNLDAIYGSSEISSVAFFVGGNGGCQINVEDYCYTASQSNLASFNS